MGHIYHTVGDLVLRRQTMTGQANTAAASSQKLLSISCSKNTLRTTYRLESPMTAAQ